MKNSTRRQTNELEFQGAALGWINDELRARMGAGLDRATQEKPRQTSGKRNDIVVWRDRSAEIAFLAMELKTPSTPINDPVLLADAVEKAQKWRAAYFAIWNMRQFEVYVTPAAGSLVLPSDAIAKSPLNVGITSVEDWLKPVVETSLKRNVADIIDAALEHQINGGDHGVTIDTEIFVARLTEAISKLRALLYRELSKQARSNRRLRQKLNAVAAAQGFLGFVDDIDYAIAGQIAYRYVGQILFYHALRRKISALRPIELATGDVLPDALTTYWNDVRRYDYEALFGPHELDGVIPIGPDATFLLRQLIGQLSGYDWSSLSDDVLGSIFEHLIPRGEQILLGQFYTPREVAELLVAFTVDGERPLVLDPGCGSGTFLMSAYDYLRSTRNSSHGDLLSTLWGFDISPFAAELAVINLYRQNMSEYENFPRIVTGSFIDRKPGQTVPFPAPRVTSSSPQKVQVPIPRFDAILANPPYVRSQHQDDLDPNYRGKLFQAAAQAGVNAPAKTDLFAFFIYHSMSFLTAGGRIGFVTSSSWLTADYAATLQETMIANFQIIAIITSSAESFFSQVAINTVLIIAERRVGLPTEDEMIRFVQLKQRITTLTAGAGDHWRLVEKLADEIEAIVVDDETDRHRVKLVRALDELNILRADRSRPRNWSRNLRAPLSYYDIFENPNDRPS